MRRCVRWWSTRCLTRNTLTSSLPVSQPKQKQVICLPAVMGKPQCFGGSRPLNARYTARYTASTMKSTCVAANRLQKSREMSSLKAKMIAHVDTFFSLKKQRGCKCAVEQNVGVENHRLPSREQIVIESVLKFGLKLAHSNNDKHRCWLHTNLSIICCFWAEW